jgi:predicted transcriptional regulator
MPSPIIEGVFRVLEAFLDRPDTVPNIAQRLNMTDRMVYRNIKHLSDLGFKMKKIEKAIYVIDFTETPAFIRKFNKRRNNNLARL